jgi:hypothetical protein
MNLSSHPSAAASLERWLREAIQHAAYKERVARSVVAGNALQPAHERLAAAHRRAREAYEAELADLQREMRAGSEAP